jgi:hypothetical protein
MIMSLNLGLMIPYRLTVVDSCNESSISKIIHGHYFCSISYVGEFFVFCRTVASDVTTQSQPTSTEGAGEH